jgi:hypothetical protein
MWTARSRRSKEGWTSRATFDEQVSLAKDLEERAWRLPPGPERETALRMARHMDIANHLNEWLSSPGLRAPK